MEVATRDMIIVLSRTDKELYCIFINEDKNVKPCLVNGIRRTILSNIEVPAFDVESLEGYDNPNLKIIENTSKYNNAYIAHRIGLIPLNLEEFRDDYSQVEELEFELNVQNDTGNEMYVKTSHFTITYQGKKVDATKIIKNQQIIIAKLLPPVIPESTKGESLHLIAKCKYGSGSSHAKFTPTSNIEYWFEEEDTVPLESSEKTITESHERVFKKADNGEPLIINMRYRTKGSLKLDTILRNGINQLKEDIASYVSNIQHGTYTCNENTNAMGAIDIIATNKIHHGHSIGNIVKEYARMFYNDQIEFIAYKIPHPLKDEMVMRIKARNPGKSHSDTCRSLVSNTCDEVIKILGSISKQFDTEWKSS